MGLQVGQIMRELIRACSEQAKRGTARVCAVHTSTLLSGFLPYADYRSPTG